MEALRTRPAAVAGVFYPDDPGLLVRDVNDRLARATATGPVPKALVVPHAGYAYSGRVAAAAYASVKAAAARVERVILIGPSHRVAFHGIAVPQADVFATPAGDVRIDREARTECLRHPAVFASDRAHAAEHSLEVQLPFLSAVLGDFTVLPLLAGDVEPESVAAVLDRVWGGAETLVVVSTDLSHFHDAETARRLDARTAARIVAFETTLGGEEACGAMALNGFLLAARRRGLVSRQLDLCNSADTAGDPHRVVGYGAFAFDEPFERRR